MNGSTKLSIASALLIVAVGGALGLKHQQRLTVLHGEQRELAARARQLGISTEAAADLPLTKRQRDDRAKQANAMAREFIAFGREIEIHDQQGNESDEAFEKRGLEMQAKLMGLDASQLKVLIASLRDDKSLSNETRQNLICYSIAMIGEDHPAAALALYYESADILADSLTGSTVVSSTLANWAKKDPLAAREWVSKNTAEHPDLADDEAKRNIVAGAAENDPKLAFKLIGEMQLEDATSAVQLLVEAGRTAGQRTAILAALREHLATLPEGPERDDLLQESLETMGRNLSNESFEAVQSWISESKLNSAESAQFAAGLSYFNTKQDTGRWIDWMAQNLPAEAVANNVDNLIGQWTQEDYQAAGKWLAAAADGPAKQAAVSTYAGTVAEYEPQTAVQWALTLPAGEARQATFESIYQNWPKSDAAAAAAFAKQYGVDTQEEP
ncbi:MAG: hypothetical protein V4819_09890 [Verrucomicrobiota bacterium]